MTIPEPIGRKAAHFALKNVIRPNILALHPYRCARDDYSEGILLDANENAIGHAISSADSLSPKTNGQDLLAPDLSPILDLDLNRYPDPSHPAIKSRIAELRGLPGPEYVFLGVGSDECIDLLMRVCVRPGGDERILTCPPTYGMYAVSAQVNDIGVVKVPLELSGEKGEGGDEGRFSVRVDEVKKVLAADPSIKIVFFCSPGNPTGTLISLNAIRSILEFELFKGIVMVDEAYIDFSPPGSSAADLVKEYPNLCVSQTLSKSYGLAAIRRVLILGILLAQPPLIQVLSNTKAPYNISTPTAYLASRALSEPSTVKWQENVKELLAQRTVLLQSIEALVPLGVGGAIGAQHANFLMIPILAKDGSGAPDSTRAHLVYKTLAEEEGVVVRYRGSEPGCPGCLRITVGTADENKIVLEKLKKVLQRL
ncbi:pyridoxal phosphate-dependent transferase [Vararia minispora EC-137]|uniref:Pyridoxal phosphate-dependent transferase n=1 Tax=Vararia minispora EC-137 TaxID=1314806 RepID=A0ACB8QWJ2_9AGAM|nr:pyridoxal phosphate-dependent transferase [Vararia minispora EC-137]